MLPFSKRAAQSPEGKYGRRKEYGVFEWRQCRDLREPWQTSPVINETLDANPGKATVIGADEIHGLALAGCDIRDLAQACVSAQFERVLCRMQPLHPDAGRTGSVSEAQFRAEIRANENELAESFVVPN